MSGNIQMCDNNKFLKKAKLKKDRLTNELTRQL